jgi:low affinity Fe/Cu permease
MNQWFARLAGKAASWAGSSWAFAAGVGVVLVWIISGPIFHFSDTWQLVINTGTTIVTFLMVFLIQNTQNRDTKALHLKMDELLRAIPDAREDEFMDLEDRDEQALERERDKLFSECAIVEEEQKRAS